MDCGGGNVGSGFRYRRRGWRRRNGYGRNRGFDGRRRSGGRSGRNRYGRSRSFSRGYRGGGRSWNGHGRISLSGGFRSRQDRGMRRRLGNRDSRRIGGGWRLGRGRGGRWIHGIRRRRVQGGIGRGRGRRWDRAFRSGRRRRRCRGLCRGRRGNRCRGRGFRRHSVRHGGSGRLFGLRWGGSGGGFHRRGSRRRSGLLFRCFGSRCRCLSLGGGSPFGRGRRRLRGAGAGKRHDHAVFDPVVITKHGGDRRCRLVRRTLIITRRKSHTEDSHYQNLLRLHIPSQSTLHRRLKCSSF